MAITFCWSSVTFPTSVFQMYWGPNYGCSINENLRPEPGCVTRAYLSPCHGCVFPASCVTPNQRFLLQGSRVPSLPVSFFAKKHTVLFSKVFFRHGTEKQQPWDRRVLTTPTFFLQFLFVALDGNRHVLVLSRHPLHIHDLVSHSSPRDHKKFDQPCVPKLRAHILSEGACAPTCKSFFVLDEGDDGASRGSE